MQLELHRRSTPDPDRGRSRRRSHSAWRQRQQVYAREHRASQGRRLSHRPPLCRRRGPRRNCDPSPSFCCGAGIGNAVAEPRVSARRAESFGSVRGLLADTPAGSAPRSPLRSTPAPGHTRGTRRCVCRNAGNRTPEPLPAPPTRPPTGRWTAPGRAGIKVMPNGSPPSNRNGRGPGVGSPNQTTRALIYLEPSRASAPTPAQTPLQPSTGISRETDPV